MLHVNIHHDSNKINFCRIHELIRQERDILQVGEEQLRQSYINGLAVVLLIDGHEEGYMRYSPLLDATLGQKLGLPMGFPEIYEMGTSVVAPHYRGKRLSELMRKECMRIKLDDIYSDKLLVLGTTKNQRSVNSIRHICGEFGIDFQFACHSAYGFIAPLTCVCSQPLGMGFQHAPDCSERIHKDAPILSTLNKPRVQGSSWVVLPEHFECVMWISSGRLALQINTGFEEHFGSQSAFVEQLKSLNYYS